MNAQTKEIIERAIHAWTGGYTTEYGNINTWDVSDIKDMSELFKNGRIGQGWDEKSYVIWTNNFNSDISYWDVSGVTNMTSMFEGASIFNKDISSWNNKFDDVPTVVNMFLNSGMNFGDKFQYPFKDTSQLKTAVDDWILDQTQATLTYGDINTWDVSEITDMSELFKNSRLKQGQPEGGEEIINTATFNSNIY